MTDSEVIRRYISYCLYFVPHVHTGRGEMPLTVFKMDHIKIEKFTDFNCITFDLVDVYGAMFTYPHSDSYLNRMRFGEPLNRVVMRGNICMRTGYVQLVDIFNGQWFYGNVPENIQTFDEYVANLENLGLKEKPKGLIKIPAHMMAV